MFVCLMVFNATLRVSSYRLWEHYIVLVFFCHWENVEKKALTFTYFRKFFFFTSNHCLLYTRWTLSLIVLTHWNNSLWVDLSLLLLLTSAFFAKKHQIPIFWSLRFNLIRPQTHDISVSPVERWILQSKYISNVSGIIFLIM
jgi:hypothetical protein